MTDGDSYGHGCHQLACTLGRYLILNILRKLQAHINVIVVANAKAVGSGAKEVHLAIAPLLEQNRAHLLESLFLAVLLLRAGAQGVHHLTQRLAQLCHIGLWHGMTKASVPATVLHKCKAAWVDAGAALVPCAVTCVGHCWLFDAHSHILECSAELASLKCADRLERMLEENESCVASEQHIIAEVCC